MDLHHHRDGAQGAEDAATPARVAHVDVDAVLLGDLDVVAPDVGRAGQDGDQHVVGAGQRLAAIERGDDGGRVLALVDDALHRLSRPFEPVGVDVHQAKR